MLRITRWTLILLNMGNWMAVAFFMAAATALLLGFPIATNRIARAAAPGEAVNTARCMIALLTIGVATGVAVDSIFRRLLQMLSTVASGLPFVSANGARLREMAWALLVIQLLDLVLAGVTHKLNAAAHRIIFTWSPSATGWIAVLLLFVLAQVFARGAQMQDDVEGMV